jgi:uncharacterized protein YdaL
MHRGTHTGSPRPRWIAIAIFVVLGLLMALPASARPERKPRAPREAPVLSPEDVDLNGGHENGVPGGPVGNAGKAGHDALVEGSSVADAAAPTTQSLDSAVTSGTGTGALILYDTTGQWGWLGEMYATMTANLASHFGDWTAKPVSEYVASEMEQHTATFYVGSTYDEPLPAAFLTDVQNSSKPVVWMYNNIWQLTAADPDFTTTYGWNWAGYDFSTVDTVAYKGTELSRDGSNGSGIMNYASVGPNVEVLAQAERTDGSTFPWAVRSGNLTYVGEIPFAYFNEGDRMMAFADVMFDVLAPSQTERHRALVRIEDVSAASDPEDLRAIADYLFSENVPFSVAVIPRYRDPLGVQDFGPELALADSPDVVAALEYMESKGGTIIEHGWTHQYSDVANPYDGVSANDTEFYRVIENPDMTLTWVGPVAEDSPSWNQDRLDNATSDLAAAGFSPTIFEFPHYTASATAYEAVADDFTTRYDRTLYFPGVLTGGTIDHTRIVGQLFPFVVRDVYGTKVLPENLGNVEPEPWFQYPQRLPEEIIRDAERNLVVRDGFASFYFHPYLDIDYLQETVEGIKQAGYTFVAATSL